jgi:uncharacterized membrane protein YgcG
MDPASAAAFGGGVDGDVHHGTAEAEAAGSALLDSVRSLGSAFSDDLLLHRLASVAGAAGAADLDAAVAAALAARAPPSPAAPAAVAPSSSSPSPLPKPPPHQPRPGPSSLYTPYRPNLTDRLRRRLLGPEFQLAAQIAVGLTLTALFVFVDAARFPGACVASTLFLVAAVQSSPAAHVGSRLGAAASFLGAMWVGGVLAGAVVSLARALAMAGGAAGSAGPHAHAPEPGLTIALSALSIPVLLLFAAVRMAPAPPALQGTGLSLTLFYGLPLISARGAPSYSAIWSTVLSQYVTGLVAVGAALFVSLFVLPSLASEAVEDAVSRALRIAGQSLSRTSARVFSPPETSAVAVAAALERKRSRDASKHGGKAAFGDGEEKEGEEKKAAAASVRTSTDSEEDDDEDDDDDDDARIVDRTRLSPDAWVVGAADGGARTAAPPIARTPSFGLPLVPRPLAASSGVSATAAAAVARSARSSGRLPSFVEAARRLPPAPVPGSGGAIVMEREPDDVPGFHVWWDLVSAPVDEPPSARRQRRRRELALRDRGEHRQRVVAQALARARQRQQDHKEQQQQQQQQQQKEQQPAPAPTTASSSSARQSPFAAARVAADDLEQQRQQQEEEEEQEAWAHRAYEEALLQPPPAAGPSYFFSSNHHHAPNLLDLGAPGPPIAGLRPLLGAARVALGAAALEPAFLRGRKLRRFDPQRWAALIAAVESLVTRVSALEAVAEDGGGLNEERAVWLAPMLAAKRRAFAEAAACLAILSEAAKDSKVVVPGRRAKEEDRGACAAAKPPSGGGGPGAAVCSAEQLFGRSWQTCREELKKGLMIQVEMYVRAVREAVAEPAARDRSNGGGGDAAAARGDAHSNNPQKPRLVLYSGYNARIHFFAFVVTAAVLDGMQRVDDAAREALCPVRLAQRQEEEEAEAGTARRLLSSLRAPPAWVSALAGMVVMRPAAAHLTSLVPLVRAYFAPLFASASCRGGRNGNGGNGNGSDPPPAQSVGGLTTSASGISTASAATTTTTSSLFNFPSLPPIPREAVATVKYGLAAWLALTATLVALAANAHARRLMPVYGFVAVAIATTERVEATASRVASWVLGSTIGGALGLAIMAPPLLAADAAGLALLIATFSFAVSLLGMTAFRTTIVLSLMTLTALVLCQYTDGCRLFVAPPPDPAAGPGAAAAAAACVPHGTVEVFVARISAVAAGVLLSQLVTSCLAPWFTSDWALVTMARALRDGAAPFLVREYDRFFEEGKAAAEASAPAAAASAEATPGGEQKQQDLAATSAAAVRALQTSVASPLVSVQLSLARDAVQWRRGVLVVPPAVPLVLRSMLSLLDRLAALEITLQLGAPITGRFTGVAWRHYFLPMEASWRGVVVASRDLAGATAAHLVAGADRRRFAQEEEAARQSDDDDRHHQSHRRNHHHHHSRRKAALCAARDASRKEVLRALSSLHAARNRARDAQVAARMAHVRAMIEAPSDRAAFSEFVAPDDTLRYLAFITAWIKALNRLESVARAAIRDEDFCFPAPPRGGRGGSLSSSARGGGSVVGSGGGGGGSDGAGGGGGGSGTGRRAAWWSMLR